MRRSYFELVELPTFEERFEYLQIQSAIGDETFGYERSLNQKFYTAPEWRNLRNHIITRDNGNDLGIPFRPINGRIIVHHINPLTKAEVRNGAESLWDPNNLICVSHRTHNAIHFGELPEVLAIEERTPGDTNLWKSIRSF